MAEKRKGLSKKLRFEVLKRDSFTCQYCGAKSPDVVLNVDHIEPVAKGGTSDSLNLITACFGCNSGKSDRLLSDNTTIEKQRDQLDKLHARKEQLEMLFEWKKGLIDIDGQVVVELSEIWASLAKGFVVNERGKESLRKLLKKYAADEIIKAMEIAASQYIVIQGNGPTGDSVGLAFDKIKGICRVKKEAETSPDASRLFYIRGILRNRLNYVNDRESINLLRQARDIGATIESLEGNAKSVRNWSAWRSGIKEFISNNLAEE